MASVKELRQRIKSVGNIKQITRAMEMVATTKLRRFQDRAVASRPYAEEISSLVAHLAGVLGGEVEKLPLFREGAGELTAVLLVTSDRGLCGAYNSNLFAALERWLREQAAAGQDLQRIRFFVYGRKGAQYLHKRGLVTERYFVEPALEAIDFAGAARTARTLTEAFLSGEYREVKLLYTAFHSMVRYEPTWVEFLPVRGAAGEEGEAAGREGDVILEPDAATIFERLVPSYLDTRTFNVLLESLTSEYASRRVSMKAATDAATDMQKLLKGKYNRLRQESITSELLDIVGGAEALR